ncbi:hypothetical protein JD276_02150 [Leucobacter sp. CSA1]|uniref:DUF4232 domain-containing protein n=1 Tax=Leucobacter chromiisoli TaxID=2796471 RepID=A0A934Q6P6_9MICO|nr:hypothetical protein [Leucobacter chromiisoli]MBK0417837.1 hypothetical protein [Leucobacter chromiisoli]
MSTLRNPVGPKDRKVYIRRRLFVLLGLLALIAVVVLIVVKPGSSGGARGAGEVSVPGDIAASEEQPDEEEDADEPPACSAGQLAVTPMTDAQSYAEGVQPQLSLSVENTGDAACSTDLGTAGMQFAISSGDDEVWRASDCMEEPDHRNVILEPGQPLETEPLTWNRERSSPDTCGITREPVTAGGASYHLRVAVGEVQGAGTAQFLLY